MGEEIMEKPFGGLSGQKKRGEENQAQLWQATEENRRKHFLCERAPLPGSRRQREM